MFRTVWSWAAVLVVLAGSAGAEPRKDRCVVLISVDGLAGFYLDDPRADLPTLRKLAAEGARAEGVVCSFPTVTWPNHTTLVTGVPPAKHGVLGNNYLDRASQSSVALIMDPLFDKEEIVKVPTIYDAAHAAGLSTAAICWPAVRNARTLDWSAPDMPGDGWQQYGTQSWMEELRAAGIPVDKHGTWCKEKSGGTQRDWLYTRMAKQLFERHPPNLMLVHLIEVDHVEHGFGPRTPEAYWAASYADDRVRDIVEAARASKFKDDVTIVVVSDHGFYPIEKMIRPNVRLKELGLITEVEGKPQRQAMAINQGGACMVYILDAAHREQILKQLREELATIEGVDRVIGPEQFAELGVAQPEQDPRAPDLWLSAQSGYAFDNSEKGSVIEPRETLGGTHGYLPDQPDLYATLVMAGAGIRPGVKLGRVASIDVAPTVAKLLGVELPTADGKPLVDALRE